MLKYIQFMRCYKKDKLFLSIEKQAFDLLSPPLAPIAPRPSPKDLTSQSDEE
jgi:hypothetical protein